MLMGTVKFVGAGPGDPELITLKGWRAMHAADAVLYDSLIDERLLEDVPGERFYVGKRCGAHAMPQEQINALMAEQALLGRQVARIKGGDPVVLGRLGEEVLHLVSLGIPYEIIPGVTSATSVAAYAGIPVTHRGVADSFTVLTAHRRYDELEFSIPPYNARTTLVLLMALRTTAQWRAQLLVQGYPGDLPVAFISDGCSERQRVLVTTLAEAAEAIRGAHLRSPTLAVAGWVVQLREQMRWFDGAVNAPAAAGLREGLHGSERV